MIFFVIAKGNRKNFGSITSPRRRAGEEAPSPYQIIAWNEVPAYDTLEKLKAAVRLAAENDPICQDMRNQSIRLCGIDPLLKESGKGDNLSTEITTNLVDKVIYYWAHPKIGNIANSPQVRPVDNEAHYLSNWNACPSRYMDEATKEAIRGLYQTLPPLDRSGHDQVRIVYNITELARAIIGEITSDTTRRLEKILALRLCHSEGLHRAQSSMLVRYMGQRGANLHTQIVNLPDDRKSKAFEYSWYYLPPLQQSNGEALWHLVENLVHGATKSSYAITSPKPAGFDGLLAQALEIWNQIPHTSRCAILMNDFRKVDNLTDKRDEPPKVAMGMPDIGALINAQGPQAVDLPYRIMSAAGVDHVPKFRSDPRTGFSLAWSWNRDEYHDATITYRHYLCPLWGGPSGHTGGGLHFWMTALGDNFPADGARTVTCGLFAFWRLYYDKRITGVHTIAETFEASCNSEVTGIDMPGAGGIALARLDLPGLASVTKPQEMDAFDLVGRCIRLSHRFACVDPIALVKLLYDTYYTGITNHTDRYNNLALLINNERDALTRQRFAVPEWSKELTTKTGTAVSRFTTIAEREGIKPALAKLRVVKGAAPDQAELAHRISQLGGKPPQ